MADVSKIDIDGVQWDIKDQNARDRIAELETNVIAQDLEDINIEMNVGFTATTANMSFHYKVGKIHFMRVELRNISGGNIGTTQTVRIGVTNIHPKKETSFILYDYENSAVLRCYLTPDGTINIGESKGVVQGNNICLGELIFAEA